MAIDAADIFSIDFREVDVYDYCDYDGKGLLVQALETHGQEGLDREIRLLSSLMYSNGQGIRLKEIGSQWMSEESSGRVGRLCWKLEYRGFYGESLLHILMICNSELHTRIAKCLLQRFPQLAHDIFQSEEYYGTTSPPDHQSLRVPVLHGVANRPHPLFPPVLISHSPSPSDLLLFLFFPTRHDH